MGVVPFASRVMSVSADVSDRTRAEVRAEIVRPAATGLTAAGAVIHFLQIKALLRPEEGGDSKSGGRLGLEDCLFLVAFGNRYEQR